MRVWVVTRRQLVQNISRADMTPKQRFLASVSALPSSNSNSRAVALVSGAHLYSHLYIMLLPPLFPVLKDTFAVGFTELGFAITVFSLVTGLTQAPIGFLVDRVGARSLLIVALIVQSLAFATIGLVPTYSVLIAMMVLAGLANAIYHPADYVILNASVDDSRMGRAFSIHTASGFFGGFLATAIAIPLATLFGWQTAIIAVGSSGILMAALLIAGSDALRDVSGAQKNQPEPGAPGGIALLMSGPIMMGLLFYVGLSTFGHGFGNFSVSALSSMYTAPLTTLGIVLSVYLFANPVGVLLGGWVADKIQAHDRFTAICLVAIAGLAFLIAAIDLSIWLIGAAFALAGLLNGVLAPSRDMLIRRMTPPGQIGKVFGFVTSGFNVAGVIAPPLFGYLLDAGAPEQMFWVAGIVCLLTVPTVLITGARGTRMQQQINA